MNPKDNDTPRYHAPSPVLPEGHYSASTAPTCRPDELSLQDAIERAYAKVEPDNEKLLHQQLLKFWQTVGGIVTPGTSTLHSPSPDAGTPPTDEPGSRSYYLRQMLDRLASLGHVRAGRWDYAVNSTICLERELATVRGELEQAKQDLTREIDLNDFMAQQRVPENDDDVRKFVIHSLQQHTLLNEREREECADQILTAFAAITTELRSHLASVNKALLDAVAHLAAANEDKELANIVRESYAISLTDFPEEACIKWMFELPMRAEQGDRFKQLARPTTRGANRELS